MVQCARLMTMRRADARHRDPTAEIVDMSAAHLLLKLCAGPGGSAVEGPNQGIAAVPLV